MFSKSWGYGVRALVRLASTHDNPKHRWQSESLAEAADLPASFLSKVLSQLASAGLVTSTRGRGGGMRLARDPGEIRLGDVVRALDEEGNFDLVNSGFEDAHVDLRRALVHRWRPYERGTKEFLHETTIADLLATLPPGAEV